MNENKKTKFQRLGLLSKDNFTMRKQAEDVTFTTTDKEEYSEKLLSKQQSKLLANMWQKAAFDNTRNISNNVTNIEMMYRDGDLMDAFPEIGAALDIIAEESTVLNPENKILNISSSSPRIKNVLEDLFVNRLNIHVTLPMITRAMCKYGNNFQLLNISENEGILGWKQLPVYEIKRYEAGSENPYATLFNQNEYDADKTSYVWTGRNEARPYQSWQIGHFRLLNDSFFLPYGVSWLNKARRHWRMLSSMEDMMLLYRLERSLERKVFKINVGAIDDTDVESYINTIASSFKRAPIFDSETGQIDLRKNFMDVSQDYFVPVRSENAQSPIENLPASQSMTSMDDIAYMQNKVLSALRIPKSFLNFEDGQGKGQALSILDIRFNRMVNKVQQALLMTLNQIAITHLFLNGFEDDLGDFSLSMNNPSPQMEMLELENLEKKIKLGQTAMADPGNGVPIYSWLKVQKEIFNLTDVEIADLLNELRLERALGGELERTGEIIKRTGLFNPSDKMYGEIGAEYSSGDIDSDGGLGDDINPSLGGGDFGGEFDDDMNSDEFDDTDVDNTNIDDVENVPFESKRNNKNLIDIYSDVLRKNHINENTRNTTKLINKNNVINDTIQELLSGLNNFIDNKIDS